MQARSHLHAMPGLARLALLHMTRIADMPHSCLIAATWHPERVSCSLAWLSARDSLVATLGRVTRGHQLIVPEALISASERQSQWRLHEGEMHPRASVCDYRDLPVTSWVLVLSICMMPPWAYSPSICARFALCARHRLHAAICYVLGHEPCTTPNSPE